MHEAFPVRIKETEACTPAADPQPIIPIHVETIHDVPGEGVRVARPVSIHLACMAIEACKTFECPDPDKALLIAGNPLKDTAPAEIYTGQAFEMDDGEESVSSAGALRSEHQRGEDRNKEG